MNRFLAYIVIPAWIGLLLTAAQARELYIWTDENGVKHYSNIAPSEATEKFQEKDEIESGGQPQEPRSEGSRQPRERPFRPPAGATEPPPEPEPADHSPDNGEERAGTFAPALDLKAFPIPQDELVAREKRIVKDLQTRLEESAVDRDTLIAGERRRLLKAIEDLEKAPLSKFGSQQNKQRQVGYYKYRLEEIEDDPATYFQYGDSDYD